jgi:3-oxoacyl-[acyl-carrier-protein] synthase II
VAHRVAIVATDVVTALAAGLEPTLSRLLAGRSAVAPIAGFDALPFGVDVAAVLPGGDATLSPEGPTRVVTHHGTILERLARTVHDTARAQDLPREEIGFFVGLGMVDSEPSALAPALCASREGSGPFDLSRFFSGAFRAIHPHWPLQMLNNVAVGQVAADLDLRGDNMVVACEADAGARALAEGLEAVRSGAARAALVAGVSERVGPAALRRSTLRGMPGQVLGEGGGALLLEGEGSARARGCALWGFLAGAGFAFEPSGEGPGPTSDAMVRAMQEALACAGASAEDVGVVFVEGTGLAEAQARRTLFGSRGPEVATVAPAVALGHLLAGAPAVAAALALAVLRLGHAPSTAHGRPRPLAKGARALVLASGSAGGAAALVVEGVR